jgi:hypothetical protein
VPDETPAAVKGREIVPAPANRARSEAPEKDAVCASEVEVAGKVKPEVPALSLMPS